MFELSDIKNRVQWTECLKLARQRVQEILQMDTSWGLTKDIVARLDAMETAVSNGRSPTQEEKNYGSKLSVLALRNFDDSDPAFSLILKELAYAFEYWDEIPLS